MSYTAQAFRDAMEAMRTHKKEVHDWLMRNPINGWARQAFNHRAKSDHVTNNMAESFNQWIDSYRSKPILQLFHYIRMKLMSRVQSRYQKGCIFKALMQPKSVEPIQQPPPLRRLPGRPHKNRRREVGEGVASDFRRPSSSVRCDICKEVGHNKRTCQKAPVKEKGPSSSQGATTKRTKDKQDTQTSSQVQTRSQASTTTSQSSVQAKLKVKMTAKAAKISLQRKMSTQSSQV